MTLQPPPGNVTSTHPDKKFLFLTTGSEEVRIVAISLDTLYTVNRKEFNFKQFLTLNNNCSFFCCLIQDIENHTRPISFLSIINNKVWHIFAALYADFK